MTNDIAKHAITLSAPFVPSALYFEEADMVEYVRQDVCTVHRRVDERLTLVLDMETREPIGFAFKGFKNFYLRRLKPSCDTLGIDFPRLSSVLEAVMQDVGDQIFTPEVRAAYQTAYEIADADNVLCETPKAA